MRKLIIAICLLSSFSMGTRAQSFNNVDESATSFKVYDKDKAFKHLDLGFTIGSPGVGIELSAPLSDVVTLRTGGVFMPHLEMPMKFVVNAGKTPERPDGMTDAEYDKYADEVNKATFQKLTSIISSLTGEELSNRVNMIGKPNMNHFKLLVDVHPFKNKKWHVTGGFYWGNTTFTEAENETKAMGSLLGMAMYNAMYDRIAAHQPLIINLGTNDIPFSLEAASDIVMRYGSMGVGIALASHPIYAQEDIYYSHDMFDYPENDMDRIGDPAIHNQGEIKYHKGDPIYNEGDMIRITPGEHNMITAKAKVNAFKPYMGFGYGGPISKDGRTKLTVDAGLLFWGGVPELTTRVPVGGMTKEGLDYINKWKADNKKDYFTGTVPIEYRAYADINMCDDFGRIYGNGVKFYVDLVKGLWAYPVVSLKISQRLF